MVTSVPSATLKFDTDFDFDLSNAQFKKEELATELHHGVGVKGRWDAFLRRLFSDVRFGLPRANQVANVELKPPSDCVNGQFVFAGSHDSGLKEESPLSGEDGHSGPKIYYDKTKSFFDNISSDMKFR